MQAAGDDIGDMFEISTVRREDWDFIQVTIIRMILDEEKFVLVSVQCCWMLIWHE